MTAVPANGSALERYLDALLSEPSTPAAPETTAAAWQSCRLGPLQLLLPGDALGTPIDRSGLAAGSMPQHLAPLRIGADDWRVLDLARCIAPGLGPIAPEALLPIANSHWLLAVPERPVPTHLPDDAIAWRAERHSRPWLAGMSRDGRQMVLDVHALVACAVDAAPPIVQEQSP